MMEKRKLLGGSYFVGRSFLCCKVDIHLKNDNKIINTNLSKIKMIKMRMMMMIMT